MFRTDRLLAVTAAAVAGVVPAAHATNADVSDGRAPDAVIAAFDGGWIDLTKGWGEATACSSDGASTVCFHTEAEMDRTMNASLAVQCRWHRVRRRCACTGRAGLPVAC